MSSWVILDLETGTQEYCGRKAHFRKNQIIAIGLKNNLGMKEIRYFDDDILTDIEIDEDILVGHNIGKFDCLYLWNMPGFQEFIKRGGKVWDTMLAEYFLSAQEHKFPALREIAVNKYGCKEREKVMEQFWDEGIDTGDIPPELVLHDLDGDVEDTERVYLGQLNLLTPQQINLLMIQNDLQLATTEMEVNGVFVDKHILNANQYDLKQKLDAVNKELNNLIKPYWKIERLEDAK